MPGVPVPCNVGLGLETAPKHRELIMRFSKQLFATGVALAALLPVGIAAQRGGFGGPMEQERKVLAQFDTDNNKRLNTAERKAAREWLATQPVRGFGGGRRGGPFGGASPAEP